MSTKTRTLDTYGTALFIARGSEYLDRKENPTAAMFVSDLIELALQGKELNAIMAHMFRAWAHADLKQALLELCWTVEDHHNQYDDEGEYKAMMDAYNALEALVDERMSHRAQAMA